MFKFKKGNSKISPKVGIYFYYGNDSKNIFKIIEVNPDTGRCNYAWASSKYGIIHNSSSTISIQTIENSIITGAYKLIPKEDYYLIPEILRDYKI